VNDLAIGPDGGLYFVTGGHGANGGVYRITWKGTIPESVSDLGEGISAAIRQPQFHSAWGRQKIAGVVNSVGDKWSEQLESVARSRANPAHYRIRALDIMQLFGPPPTKDLLLRLSMDEDEAVRSTAAAMMGLHADEETQQRLVDLLQDSDRMVRRRACEALLRAGQSAPFEALVPVLTSDDRFEAWPARRLLERLPLEDWRNTVLTADEHRLFVQGCLALLVAHGDQENALAYLNRFSRLIDDFITDDDFIDMLRLAQVALIKGALTHEDVPDLCDKLAEEFPSSHEAMNRELIRLLSHLQVTSPMDRYLAFLSSEAADLEKIHLAMHLRYLQSGWKEGQRMEIIEFYEAARKIDGGGSLAGYISSVERDFAKSLSAEESGQVLVRGAEWPSAALGVLYNLPADLTDEVVAALCELDQDAAASSDPNAKMLRIGIIAVLGRCRAERAMTYLRQLWDTEPDRRQTIAMGLAQEPGGDNFDYLVRSLPIVEGAAAEEVLSRLITVDQTPDDPEHFRQTILRGLELEERGAEQAVRLLRKWSGEKLADENDGWDKALVAWQEWYAEKYPDRPSAELPTVASDSVWDPQQLLARLMREDGSSGSHETGAQVFEEAQCVECHRFGSRGDDVGPDLTDISRRSSKKEILQSILFPSHMISEDFTTKTVITTSGRAYFGIVASTTDGELVIHQADGEQVTIREDQVDEMVPSMKSAMRDGLLDALTLEEIADLFAFLGERPTHQVAREPELDRQR
jgi:putative heme-binding domain-containing protein